MSYRENLISISKKYFLKYKDLDILELKKMINFNDLDDCFNSLPEDNHLLTLSIKFPEDDSFVLPFFNKINMKKEFESRYQILNKNGLQEIIKIYKDIILEDLTADLDHFDKNEIDILKFKANQKKEKWNSPVNGLNVLPYNLKELNMSRNNIMTYDNSFEYQIFNLVFIYNTFDWNENILIISGW